MADRSGAPLADVCVTTGAGRQAPAVTSPEGDYVLHDVAPGRTTVEFIPNCGAAPQPRNLLVQWWSGQDSAATATPVKVVVGALTTGFDATLQEGGVVAGVVHGLSLHQLGGVFLSLLPYPGPSGDIADALVGTSGAAAATAADAQTVSTNLAADGAALVRSPAAPGRFEGVGIPTGSYLLMAESLDSLLASVVFHGGAGSAGTSPFTALSVTAGATTEGANLDFPPTGILSAHVSFPTGEAEHSVCLVLLPRSAPLGLFLAEPLRPDGTFTVSGVSAATYRLQFDPCEATNVAPATIETSVLGGATTVVAATLPVGSVISDTVTGAGRPLRGACVTATSIDGSSSLPALAVTDRQGSYRIEGLARGTYGLGASACRKSQLANSVYPSPVTIGTAQRIEGLKLELTFGGTITGTVEAATVRPVGGLCVLAFRRPGGAVHVAVSARHGSYTLRDLGAGRYTLAERPGCGSDLLWTPVYAGGSLVPDGGSVVSVAAGRTTSGVDISVPRGGSISGLVTAASSVAPPSGVCVVAVPRSSTGLASSFASTANGSYTISGLAPGKYRVGFASGCGADGFRTLWYRDSLSERSTTLVTVVAGTATSAIDVRLAAGS